MKKVIQSLNWVYEILLTVVLIMCITSGLMQVTADFVYADESAVEEVTEREYLTAGNLPDDTDYVLVIDKSGSLWAQEYNGEVGVFQKIRNSATQAFLRVAAGTNNRVAIVYFDKDAHEDEGRGLTSVKSKDDYNKLLGKLNNSVPEGTDKTKENASTNIAAGLKCACDILDSQGSSERKKCIILFSDGFNDLYSNDKNAIEKFRAEKKDEIFGTVIEGTSGERRDDGLTTRIRESKYDLYCIYLENPESKDKEGQSKKTLENLVNACRADGESDEIKKFYYVSGDFGEESKYAYFDLAKQFSEVFYVSQNNSRHQDLLMEANEGAQRSQIYVPNAAVSQLNMFLINVPDERGPVLRHTLTGEEYDYVRDTNEPEMVYYNISNPTPGDYELIIPGASDARGAYAYYTELKAVIDIEKVNGFGLFPIGQYSSVKAKCSFFDAQGRLYDFMDNEHFELNASLSRDGEEAAEIPMRWNGECWETAEDIRINERGQYRLAAKTSLDNETLNTLEYVKEVGNINSMDVWVWITGLLAVASILLFLYFWAWIRRNRLRDKIFKEKGWIDKEKRAIEEKYKDINSESDNYENDINDYEECLTYTTTEMLPEYKEADSTLLLKELGVAGILDERRDYRTEYEKAKDAYISSFNDAIEKAKESDKIDYAKKDSAKSLNDKYSELHSCLEEVKKLKKEAETKAKALEELAKEAKDKYVLLDKAIRVLREMVFREFDCDIEIRWPRQDDRYSVIMAADEFKSGIVHLDDLEAIAHKKDSDGKYVDVSFKEAIGNHETNIHILPYSSEDGTVGIELESDKDFGIADLNSNIAVKSCEPMNAEQPDGEKKYVAKLEKGGQYRLNLRTDDGLGSLTLLVK